MKKVKFDDGSFGVRKFSLLRMRYVYGWAHYSGIDYWEVNGSKWFHHCRMPERKVNEIMRLCKKVKVIEVIEL